MKTIFKPALILLALTPLLALRAQVVSDGATNTLSNVTNTITGDVTVGTNGSFTLLVLSDNALLTNSLNGVIGRNATAHSNEVQAISPTARWRMGNFLYVGSNGSINRLVVSNGALVDNLIGVLGQNAGSSNNLALVTDNGSLWNTRNALRIGNSGPNNQMIVSNGGRVASLTGVVGANIGGSTNFVLVTGSGSVWSNTSSLTVGNFTPGNRLLIEAGGTVYSDLGQVGSNIGGSSNNEVIVTGPGSLWTNGSTLQIGSVFPFNRLIVSNGAAVKSGTGIVGNSNQVFVTGTGSIWSNQMLFVGGKSAQVEASAGGLLAANDGYIGQAFGSDNNTVVLTGTGSGWSNLSSFYVGEQGNGNVLIASNGVSVVSSNAFVGGGTSGGNNNFAIVTGAGTLWTNKNDFTIGNFSDHNQLVVSNGASVVVGRHFVVSPEVGSVSNSVIITGAGSKLRLPLFNSFHHLGVDGSYNRLVVKDGGFMSIHYGFSVGAFFGSSNNLVLVTDPGTIFTNENHLTITGTGDLLVVSNGAAMSTRFLRLSAFDGAAAVVTGPGSVMPTPDVLVVGGNLAYSNRLSVFDGAMVSSGGLAVGQDSGSRGRVIVSDPGSVLSNSFSLLVGHEGNGNLLVVSNGATLYSSNAIVGGDDPGAQENSLIVTGPDSTWRNGSNITVGVTGWANQLIITNGASVFSGGDLILGELASRNNRLTVNASTLRVTNQVGSSSLDVRHGTNIFRGGLIDADWLLLTTSESIFEYYGGNLMTRAATIANGQAFVVGKTGGAFWDMKSGVHSLANRLIVGTNSSFNGVFVTDGAVVNVSDYVFLNFTGTSGSNNQILVSGPGSTFYSAFGYIIDGNANRMLIDNGGKATVGVGSSGTFIGLSNGTRSNSVTVTDPDSRWSIKDALYVGSGGNAGQLVVSNGALVDSIVGVVGSGSQSSNNVAIVNGANSSWSNRSDIYVGASGTGNRLIVNEGGTLITSNTYIGQTLSSRSNIVEVTGPGSFFSNRTDLFVGYDGTDNQLVVSNGGVVSVQGSMTIGRNQSTASANRLLVDGGTVLVTNGGTAFLEIKMGTNLLNSGLIDVDILRMTNSAAKILFRSGTLSAKSSRISIGPPVLVGDGTNPATFNLAGNGLHDFAGTLGLIVRSNAALTGNGLLNVQLQVLAGALLSPGASIGKISLNSPPIFSGTIAMELSKNGAALTNDQVQVTPTITYNGALVVTHLGPTPLAAGDRFQLFSALNYAGSFDSISLPPLGPGLRWATNLLADGSIEVFGVPPVGAGTALQFDGTNDFVAVTADTRFNAFPLIATAWINTSQTNGQVGIINKYVAGSLNGWNLGLVNGEVRAWYIRDGANYVWDGGFGLNGGWVADGEWHHVAFRVDEVGGRLYVDGFEKSATFWTGTFGACTTTQIVTLARYPGGAGEFFQGTMDEAAIWRSAEQSSGDIKTNLTRGLLGSEFDLILYQRMNDGDGSPISENAATATGINGRGVLQNGVAWVPGIILKPAISTRTPDHVTATSTGLRGETHPGLTGTSGWFEWGTNTSYGNVTPAQFLGNGSTNVKFGQSISNLIAGTTYHYRALASNVVGVSYGLDQTFFTTGTNMIDARVGATATLLPTGKVLVAGGVNSDSQSLATAELFDPATGTWASTSPMTTARDSHNATLLPNGKVLVSGGRNDQSLLTSAELYDPVTGTWTLTGSFSTNRYSHTSTVLPNGKVLVTGGLGPAGAPTSIHLATTELYDPATGTWTLSGSMQSGRYLHTATLLGNGKVLVTGGSSNFVTLASSELYDPISGTWTNTGSLSSNRFSHTATLLPNGKTLVAGGFGTPSALRSAELYDPVTGTWTNTGQLNFQRFDHTASLLPNGKVLVIAGSSGGQTLEIYDPTNGTWSFFSGTIAGANSTATVLPNGKVLHAGGIGIEVLASSHLIGDFDVPAWSVSGSMTYPHYDHTATLLPDTRVLVVGFTNAQIYNPTNNTWANAVSPITARNNHRATLLANGRVLLSGGFINGTFAGATNSESFNPATGTWSNSGALNIPRGYHTATLLADGRVLVTGGTTNGFTFGSALREAEVLNPTAGTWTSTGTMSTNRYYHTATLLPNGKVLVAGGISGTFANQLATAELYDPITGTWTNTGSMNVGRASHVAKLLPNGQVLVAGGGVTFGGTATAELYDPATGTWTLTGSMTTARFSFAATLLPNGKVLAVRGYTLGYLATSELYDPLTKTWTATPSTSVATMSPTATLLANGKVLVTGGWTGNGGTNRTELFDPGQGFNSAWQPQISSATSPLTEGGTLTLSGSRFRGISEGSGSGDLDSPADYPVVQLLSVEGDRITFVPSSGWSSNSFTSTPVTGFWPGWARATVFVNGIPSTSSVIRLIASTVVTLSNLTQPFDGTARIVSVSTAPPGLPFTLTYNGSPNAPTNVGSYTVVAIVTNPNFQGGATNTLVVLPPASPVLAVQPQISSANSFVFQLQGQSGLRYVTQTSTNLTQWVPATTNILVGSTLNVTNAISTGEPIRFWRAVWEP